MTGVLVMAESGASGKRDSSLDEIFRQLKVDHNWESSTASDTLPQASCSNRFKGKIVRRSPVKEKECDFRPYSKRMRPYETDDLPFGESLTNLSLETEQCVNIDCTCNKKHKTSQTRDESLLNFAKACKSSPERKIIKDAKLKLHNQVKDHKVVLRAARLKLHKIKTNWYKEPMLRKSTSVKHTVFGTDSATSSFDSLAQTNNWVAESGTGNSRHNFNSVTFKQQRITGGVTPGGNSPLQVLPTSVCDNCTVEDTHGQLCSCVMTPNTATQRQVMRTSCPLHPGVCVKPCSCAEEARFDSQDYSVDELASYLEEFVYIPKKMSEMAEMMYT